MASQATRYTAWRYGIRWVCAWLLWITPRGASAEQGWPRAFEADDGARLLVYQPQLEAWHRYSRLVARAAFELQRSAAGEPIFGALKVQAATEADRAAQHLAQVGRCPIDDRPAQPAYDYCTLPALEDRRPLRLPGPDADRHASPRLHR